MTPGVSLSLPAEGTLTRRGGHARRGRALAIVFIAALFVKAVAGLALGTLLGFDLHPVPVAGASPAPPSTAAAALESQLARHAPRGAYVVVDRANNRLWIRDREAVEHEAVVSTGSGTVLRESGGLGRTWTFDTPSGRFEVLGERHRPVWIRPDWAFLEEGIPPPAKGAERVERGSLGEWALDLGDGYMIHGTLYERLLGRSITHGCIRVGKDDLRLVAQAVRVGTPVYIF